MKRNIATAGILISLGLIAFSLEVRGQLNRNTDHAPDQVLKSSARVNPSTLAMELSIPIGGYAGRAGVGMPVTFNYSSKVWQIHYLNSWDTGGYGARSDTRPKYAARTATGWTSSLGTPRIEYDLDIYTAFVDGVTPYEGAIFTPDLGWNPDPNPPNYSLYYVKRVRVIMPNGSSHELRKDDGVHGYGTAHSVGGPGLPDQAGSFLSVDGSRMRLELAEHASTLHLPDGGRYLFGQKTAEHKAHTFIDRHGNKMTYDVMNRRWTDTLGRVIRDPMPQNWNGFEQTQVVGDTVASFPGSGSGTLDITFSWRYLKDPNGGESGLENTSDTLHNLSATGCHGDTSPQVPGPNLFATQEPSVARTCHPGTFSGTNWTPDPPFNPVVLTTMELANGQSYEFRYNVYGEIIKIVYPGGGYERFTYAYIEPVQPGDAVYDQANRGVVSRRVSAKGDGTDEVQWTYSAMKQFPQPYTVTITAPDGTKTQQLIHSELPQEPRPFGFSDAETGRSFEDRVLSPSDQLLRRTLTKYASSGPLPGGYAGATRDLRPDKEVSIIFEPGESHALASMTETFYDAHADPEYFAFLNPKQSKTHNYIVLDLGTAQSGNIDTISALFSNSTLASVTETDYLYDANYKDRNIVGLATETRVKDAAGNIKAKTQIAYDLTETLLTDVSSTRWENPATPYRGLVTRTRSWHDIANDLYVETRAQYDQLGNLRNAWDGRGHLTQTAYSQTYDHAYPTGVTTPVPDSTGTQGSATALTSTTVYDYNTGLPTSATDANGQTTTMEYVDPLLRPTKVTAPNGHQTITEYGAGTSAATRWVKSRSQIDATNWKEAISWFDGLGRAYLSQSVEDDAEDIFAVTCFDNMGRVAKTSNPVRSGTAPTCASSLEWTTPGYDAAGRQITVTTPDGAVVETAYSLATSGAQIGTVVTVEDQANKLRRSVTNALGQLTRVDEPDGGSTTGSLGGIDAPDQPTLYGYDALSNLTSVLQVGDTATECGGATPPCTQTRGFAYDALSRLRSASNPESGTINYTYDANGNLATKTDARLIATTYAYDRLNRVTLRAYTNEPSGSETPDVTYFYDNITNAKGKLTKVGSSVSTTEYVTFDILGRVTRSKQTTDGAEYGGGSDPAKWMTYTYNLGGALIEQQYPSGRVVKNSLDSDGSLSQVQSAKAGQTVRNYANSYNYNAAGAVTAMRLGNGLWETTVFNNRLQPTQIGLGAGAVAQDKLKLNYSYGTAANNGNVLSQTITVPGAAHPFVQNYSYDSLNRLADAAETQNSSQTWRQQFSYDRYGNRNFVEATTTTLPKNCGAAPNNTVCSADVPKVNPVPITSSNKLTGYGYDSAGNTTEGANDWAYIYDAENKQVEVKNDVNATVGQYYYDGDGKRVKKYVPDTGEITVFVYDAGGKQIAEYSTIVQTGTAAKTIYTTNDHLGSPRINTDATGQIISRHDYHPFGEEIARTGYGADTIRKQFTGYERDGETDLDFAQARYYAKELGRFSSADEPFADQYEDEPQSWNLYVYVRNNPMNWVDPTGQAACPKSGCPKVCPEDKLCTLDDNGNVTDVKDAPPEIIETREKNRNPFRDFFSGFRRVAEPWQPIIEAVTPAGGPGGLVVKGGMWVFRGAKWLFTAGKAANGVRRSLPVLQKLCFVAGTPVLTRGGLKSIEEISEGDEVLSYNERTKRNEYKTVVRTFERFAEAGRILSVKVEAEAAPLGVTHEHPFYVRVHRARDNTADGEDKGEWVEAGSLRVGDQIHRADGDWAEVESIAQRQEGAKVYNFEVADNHNYFVGKTSLLAHNSNECFRIVERAGDVIHAVATTAKGEVQVVANVVKQGGTVILQKLHVQGAGAGSLGVRELRRLEKAFVQQIGKQEGASKVIIEGGARQGGVNPGRIPRPRTYNVD